MEVSSFKMLIDLFKSTLEVLKREALCLYKINHSFIRENIRIKKRSQVKMMKNSADQEKHIQEHFV